MKYQPPAIDQSNLAIAVAPEIGAESQVRISFEPWKILGDVSMPAAASGVLALLPTYDLTAEPNGLDLQLISVNGLKSSVECVVTLNVKFADDTTGTATGSFAVPARSKNQTFVIPQGAAVDVAGVGAGAAKKIKQVISIASVIGGSTNSLLRLVSLPEEDTYSLVGAVTEAGLKLNISKSIAIPDRFDGSAFVKRGRSEPGSLSIKARYVDYMDGLGRMNGHFVTARIDVLKDDHLLTERTVLFQYKPAASPNRGDGDAEVTADSEGNFQAFATFVAL